MKIEERVCTIEQMKELKELGFDTEKASMAWCKIITFSNPTTVLAFNYDLPTSHHITIKTFTIGDMLDMLPKKVSDDGYECFLCIEKYDSKWHINYRYEDDDDDCHYMYYASSKSLRDTLVAELKMLKENKEI